MIPFLTSFLVTVFLPGVRPVSTCPIQCPGSGKETTAPELIRLIGPPHHHHPGPTPLSRACNEFLRTAKKPGPDGPAGEFPAAGKYPGPHYGIAGDFPGRNRHQSEIFWPDSGCSKKFPCLIQSKKNPGCILAEKLPVTSPPVSGSRRIFQKNPPRPPGGLPCPANFPRSPVDTCPPL